MSQGIRKEYLGDSVYVETDGYVICLTTENGFTSDPSNCIVLEMEVYENLEKYVNRLGKLQGSQTEAHK